MKPLGVSGPSDAGKTTIIERLVGRLEDRGRVATVKHIGCQVSIDEAGKDTHRHRAAGAAETYGVMPDGSWFATGEQRTLDSLLADLAPDYDYVLVEGYSQAAIPTVALGGRDHAGETLATAPNADALEATDPFETLDSLVARVKRSADEAFAGAIATFTGRVRRQDDPEDTPTEYLEFERYDDVAAERLDAISADLTAREGVYEVALHHRTGVVEAGEDIVFVVVLGGHREEAFAAVSDGIDRLKDEVPLFKKEVTVEGAHWKHEETCGTGDNRPDPADERRDPADDRRATRPED